MSIELITITRYCELHEVEPDFLMALQEEGLIEIVVQGEGRYLVMDQLPEMEKFLRWHKELGLNLEGIEVVNNLLVKLLKLQEENRMLRDRLFTCENRRGENT